MARITWLADVLRAEGLSVREHAGWQTRGHAAFSAQGLVLHHTAGRTGSVHPSLGICINGRPRLPGPLCHVLVDREGVCHVIAAGRANHAGAGRWRHLSANSQVVGIEIEHSGSLDEPWTARVLDASMGAAAAICRRASIPPALVCLHKEWAPTRKIDPIGWHGPTTRDRIARLITPPDPILEDDDMLLVRRTDNNTNHLLTGGSGKGERRPVNDPDLLAGLVKRFGDPIPAPPEFVNSFEFVPPAR